MDMFPVWYLGFTVALTVGLGINLDLYLRHVRDLNWRASNLDAWEDELIRREKALADRADRLEDRHFDLMRRETTAVHEDLISNGK